MSERVLICGVNWLGDCLMSMPALQLYRRMHPAAHLAVLVKSKLVPLWKMQPCVDDVIAYEEDARGTWHIARELRAYRFHRAFVLPNSFRSALIPFLAGIPVRIGYAGHQRRWLLTSVRERPKGEGRVHQVWEYLHLLDVEAGYRPDELPRLDTPAVMRGQARERLAGKAHWLALIPGAAYGPSKRWPADSFVEVGRRFVARGSWGVVVLGSGAESDLCSRVARGIGAAAIDLAGKTSLSELAAVLEQCRVVVTNDSGGMHLAAAMGAGVVAIFGITDPRITGPLGRRVDLLGVEGVKRSRDIPRDCPDAVRALAAIRPEMVYEAAVKMAESR